MNKELAADFARMYREFGGWFNELTELTIELEKTDVEGARKIRRANADMLFLMEDAFARDLRKEYPRWFDD